MLPPCMVFGLRLDLYVTPFEYCVAYCKRGYFRVDVDGAVWRLRVHRKGSHFDKQWLRLPLDKIRRAETSSGEYLVIPLVLRDRKRQVPAHWLSYHFNIQPLIGPVLLALQQGNLCVNHKDGDKHNNHPSNLELITKQANALHARDVLKKGPWATTNVKQTYEQLMAVSQSETESVTTVLLVQMEEIVDLQAQLYVENVVTTSDNITK